MKQKYPNAQERHALLFQPDPDDNIERSAEVVEIYKALTKILKKINLIQDAEDDGMDCDNEGEKIFFRPYF